MIKEDIATYRAYLLLISTSLFGVIGYAIVNINKLDLIQMTLGILISFALIIAFVFLIKKYLKIRKILEEMP